MLEQAIESLLQIFSQKRAFCDLSVDSEDKAKATDENRLSLCLMICCYADATASVTCCEKERQNQNKPT